MSSTFGDEGRVMGNGRPQWNCRASLRSQHGCEQRVGRGIGDDLGWFPFPAIPEGAGNRTTSWVAAMVRGRQDAPDEAIDF